MAMEVIKPIVSIGPEVSEFAKRKLPDILLNNSKYSEGVYDQALVESFLEVDKILFTEQGAEEIKTIQAERTNNAQRTLFDSMPDKGPDGRGCTANVILFKDGNMYIANAGDSRSILATKGIGIDLSRDHKPEDKKETERIIKAGGYVTNGRVVGNLNLSRALGDLQYKRAAGLKLEEQMITSMPDILKQKLGQDYDFIVMGCDGIYDTLTTKQIVEHFYKEFKEKPDTPLKQLVEEFVDSLVSPDYTLNEGRGCDNMTCILIKFNRK